MNKKFLTLLMVLILSLGFMTACDTNQVDELKLAAYIKKSANLDSKTINNNSTIKFSADGITLNGSINHEASSSLKDENFHIKITISLPRASVSETVQMYSAKVSKGKYNIWVKESNSADWEKETEAMTFMMGKNSFDTKQALSLAKNFRKIESKDPVYEVYEGKYSGDLFNKFLHCFIFNINEAFIDSADLALISTKNCDASVKYYINTKTDNIEKIVLHSDEISQPEFEEEGLSMKDYNATFEFVDINKTKVEEPK